MFVKANSLRIHRSRLFLALTIAFTWGPSLIAADAVTPGSVIAERPTLKCIGFRWPIEGDENRNAVVKVAYRQAAGGEFPDPGQDGAGIGIVERQRHQGPPIRPAGSGRREEVTERDDPGLARQEVELGCEPRLRKVEGPVARGGRAVGQDVVVRQDDSAGAPAREVRRHPRTDQCALPDALEHARNRGAQDRGPARREGCRAGRPSDTPSSFAFRSRETCNPAIRARRK